MWIVFCLPLTVQAGDLFYGYKAYYTTQPGRLFSGNGHDLEPFSEVGTDGVIFGWRGRDAGRSHTVELRDGRIKLDGKILSERTVKAFPVERVYAGDLDRSSVVFFAGTWACIEDTPPSASGTAARHKSVYFIKLGKQHQAWKLPTLFASCLGVRMKAGQPIFDKVHYRYQDDNDAPVGLTFTEYAIKGGGFVETGSVRNATFVEGDNVYKFALLDGGQQER
ncbi:hypothetical protein AAFM71_07460 [Chromobacterium violaceum]|uniref:hypothetical protein n=1 Tax=Chromobacterium violaceum TaxID=536 RepID=UPI00385DD5DF